MEKPIDKIFIVEHIMEDGFAFNAPYDHMAHCAGGV